MTKKKILFLTGTRADYGKLKSLMKIIDQDEQFACSIFVTGMHMLSDYGQTELEVVKGGFSRIFSFMNQHRGEPMEDILANTIRGLSRYVHENRPDLLVVHGDRVEALAGAIVGSINNILVAHIEGGERSGSIDESIRHAASKMSHLHFVANDEARQRLIQMGETPTSVFAIGSPDIDIMLSKDLPSLPSVCEHYEIDFEKYGILIFHPVTTQLQSLFQDAKILTEAVLESKRNYVVIMPNNDEGTQTIANSYTAFEGNSRFRVFPSIRFESFLVLLRQADFVIGNSSAGIREAPFYGVPAINIGTRQNHRFSDPSIKNVNFDKAAILQAIEEMSKSSRKPVRGDYFGTGNSAHKFLEVLRAPSTWAVDTQKVFVDVPVKN